MHTFFKSYFNRKPFVPFICVCVRVCVCNIFCQTNIMALEVVLPHDGERGHVQSNPGPWLKLCLVQLQKKNDQRLNFPHTEKKN